MIAARNLRFAVASAVALAAACSSTPAPKVVVFTSAPATIAPGSKATLVWFLSGGAATSVTIDNGVGDVTGQSRVDVHPATTTAYKITAKNSAGNDTATATVTVSGTVSNGAVAFNIAAPASATAGSAASVTVTARDATGNPVTGYTGTVHFASDDTGATLPADLTFAAADGGSKTASVTFKRAGARQLTVTDTAASAIEGDAVIPVSAGPAAALVVSGLPASAASGAELSMAVAAQDSFGNLATSYTGTWTFTSTDAKAALPGSTAATGGAGNVVVSFGIAGTQKITVSDGTLTATSAGVLVIAGPAASLTVAGPAGATAGVAASVTATAHDAAGNAANSYTGTVHFSSDDPDAILPADTAFTATDQGSKTFSVKFKKAGTRNLNLADTVAAAIQGSAQIPVVAAAASALVLSALPATAAAGADLALAIVAQDPFGNTATAYTGTWSFASTDGKATLPNATASASGAASVAFSFAIVGNQKITVSDGTLTTTSPAVAVTPGPPATIAVATVTDANAGAPKDVTLTIYDAFGNVVTGFTGSIVMFTTDSAASLPTEGGNYTFVIGDHGTHTFTGGLTFATIGPQTFTAIQGEGPLQGTATINVHGYVYTNPSGGSVQLQNDSSSTAALALLDLTYTGPGALGYSVGLDIPLVDASRAALDATPITLVGEGILQPGGSPAAMAAVLPTSGPLLGAIVSGLSQKASGVGANVNDQNLSAGSALYQLRIALPPNATQGVVFDGAALGAKYRASLRDHLGNETVGQSQFALGRLEIR